MCDMEKLAKPLLRPVFFERHTSRLAVMAYFRAAEIGYESQFVRLREEDHVYVR